MASQIGNFQAVARVGEILEDRGEPFEIAGRPIVVFLHEGAYYALDDICPHQGAPLSEGLVECGVVTCSWHGWKFGLKGGERVDHRKGGVGTYPVRVVDGEIQVAVD